MNRNEWEKSQEKFLAGRAVRENKTLEPWRQTQGKLWDGKELGGIQGSEKVNRERVIQAPIPAGREISLEMPKRVSGKMQVINEMERETVGAMGNLVSEAEIARFSVKNPSVILAKVLGISQIEAAGKILNAGVSASKSSWSALLAIAIVLGKPVEKTEDKGNYPTVGSWMKMNRGKVAILRSGDGFVYVGLGNVMAGKVAGLVTHSITIMELGV